MPKQKQPPIGSLISRAGYFFDCFSFSFFVLARFFSFLVFGFEDFNCFDLVTFAWNFSTLPAASINLSLPVKNGWHCEQTSTSISGLVAPIVKTAPQAHFTFAS